MLEGTKYSEKEISIFQGLINLMKEGANPYCIKVSDIAKAANIGKGTVYDYFDSKEEAISKAIIYNIFIEINIALERIKSKDNFRDMFYEVLKIIVDNIENNLSTFNMLWSTGGVQEFYEYLVDDKYDLSDFITIVNNEVDRLLKLGFNEGIISTKESYYYQLMAIQGAISGFSHYISKKDFYREANIEDTCIEDAMNIAYKILIKALN